MSSIQSLLVDLQVEDAKLKKGIADAEKKVAAFGEKLDSIGKSINLAMGFDFAKEAVSGLARLVQQGAQAADSMGKLSASLGVPVEQLSKLNYAADFAGVSTQQLGAGLGKLTKLMGEAAGGGKRQAAIFSALGINIADANGKLKSSSDVMTELAERFAGLEDGTAKASIAQTLFGESGAAMIPLLNEGAEGLKRAGEEADRFGVTVTEQGAVSAAAFNDALTRLQKVGEGLANRVATELTPILVRLSGEMSGVAGQTNAMAGASKGLSAVLKVLVSAGAIVGGVFEAAGTTIGRVASAIVNAAKGNFAEIGIINQSFTVDLLSTTEKTVERIKAIWDDGTGAAAAIEKEIPKAKKSADKLGKAVAEAMAGASGKTKTPKLPPPPKVDPKAGMVGGLLGEIIGGEAKDYQKARFAEFKAASDAAARLAGALHGVADGAIAGLIGQFGALGQVVNASRDAFSSVREAGGSGADAIAAGATAGLSEVLGMSVGALNGIIEGAESLRVASDRFGMILQLISDGWSAAFSPLKKFGALIHHFGKQILDAVMPALEAQARGMMQFAPALVVIGTFVAALAKTYVSLAGGFGSLDDAGKFLFDAMKFAATSVIGAAEKIMHTWNVATHHLSNFLRALGMVNEADSLMAGLMNTQPLLEALANLKNMTFDTAMAKANEIAAIYDLADATKEATAELLNVPTGYKVALSRFNATDGVGSDTSWKPQQLPGNINIAEVHIDADDPSDFWKRLRAEAEKHSFQNSGFSTGGA